MVSMAAKIVLHILVSKIRNVFTIEEFLYCNFIFYSQSYKYFISKY